MEQQVERRAVEQPVELRANDGGLGVLVGHGAVFNSPSRDLGGWREVIDPGAFGENTADGTLDLTNHTRVLARFNHDSSLLLGTTDAGTLRLSIDDVGLRYEIDLPDTTTGRDVAALAARGDLRFSSFAFRVLPDGQSWAEDADGSLVRHVSAASLADVAPVTDPAYWGTDAGLRSIDLDEVRRELHRPDSSDLLSRKSQTAAARLRLKSHERNY